MQTEARYRCSRGLDCDREERPWREGTPQKRGAGRRRIPRGITAIRQHETECHLLRVLQGAAFELPDCVTNARLQSKTRE